jgi:hypothetical protein
VAAALPARRCRRGDWPPTSAVASATPGLDLPQLTAPSDGAGLRGAARARSPAESPSARECGRQRSSSRQLVDDGDEVAGFGLAAFRWDIALGARRSLENTSRFGFSRRSGRIPARLRSFQLPAHAQPTRRPSRRPRADHHGAVHDVHHDDLNNDHQLHPLDVNDASIATTTVAPGSESITKSDNVTTIVESVLALSKAAPCASPRRRGRSRRRSRPPRCPVRRLERQLPRRRRTAVTQSGQTFSPRPRQSPRG